MEINIKYKQRVKAFFKDGRPLLILKSNLPFAEGENGEFNSRFNGFYESVFCEYLKMCEKLSEHLEKLPRPLSLNVDAKQKSTPGDIIFITRSQKMRYPDGKTLSSCADDVFDCATGLLKRVKKNKKRERQMKAAEALK